MSYEIRAWGPVPEGQDPEEVRLIVQQTLKAQLGSDADDVKAAVVGDTIELEATWHGSFNIAEDWMWDWFAEGETSAGPFEFTVARRGWSVTPVPVGGAS